MGVLSRVASTTSRQGEIVEVVLRNGWGYMRQLLTGGKAGEPALPPPAVLRNILVELGPVYVKLGQLLSTRPDLLPASYIEALSKLQADVPASDWEEMEGLLREEYGDRSLSEIFEVLDPVPVAAGSIAQVHRGRLLDGREVAVKVQRPGLERLVRRDTDLIMLTARLASTTDFGQSYDIVGLAKEFTQSLQAELSFTREANTTNRFRESLANSRWFDSKKVSVPRVIEEATTERVLVLEWIAGTPILKAAMSGEAYGGDAQVEREEIARLLLRVFFQQVCVDGFFHADPHPGNLFYLGKGRVALLDCGMAGSLDPKTQEILISIVLAIATLDPQRCAQLVLQLSPPEAPVRLIQLQNDFDRLLRRYAGVSLSRINFGEMFYEVLGTARKNQIRVPGNLGLCAKAIANLEGVAREINPEFDFVAEIEPLSTDLLQARLIGDRPVPTALQMMLDFKSLAIQSPRQVEILLERLTSETLQWNMNVQQMEGLGRSFEDSANRLSFSIVVGALIIGAATIATPDATSKLYWVGNALFV
ncbi:MAG: AarF/ABC1/UbiB kinase family protein, partial [Cyanobacteria bacterium J06642_12]